MKIMLKAATMAAILALTGCATPKLFQPVGGSRADGTVRLSFQHTAYEAPVYDVAQGTPLAVQRCKAWGYTDAEAFGSPVRKCLASDAYGSCNLFEIGVEYQCVGKPEATK